MTERRLRGSVNTERGTTLAQEHKRCRVVLAILDYLSINNKPDAAEAARLLLWLEMTPPPGGLNASMLDQLKKEAHG